MNPVSPYTAEKPIAVIERGNAEPDLLAFTAVSRFDDHSPYHRQENGQFKRAGIDIPRSTQCDWMRQIGELLTPLYDRKDVLLATGMTASFIILPLLPPYAYFKYPTPSVVPFFLIIPF